MIQVLKGKVVVLPLSGDVQDEKTEGGIILPGDIVDDGNVRGQIVASQLEDMYGGIRTDLDGKIAIYDKIHGKKVRDEGKDYIILSEDQVIAIVDASTE